MNWGGGAGMERKKEIPRHPSTPLLPTAIENLFVPDQGWEFRLRKI